MGAPNLEPTITITHWPSLWETHKGTAVEVTLAELADWILSYAEAPHSGEGWAPTTFTGKRSKANVEGAHAIGLDFDEGAPLDALVAHLRHNVGVVHETRHSSTSKPCARAVLFASRVMSAREYELVRGELARRCNEAGLATDEATKDASRFWYLPGACPGGCEKDCGGMARRTLAVHTLDGGHLVDVDEVLVEAETRQAIQDDRPAPPPSAPRATTGDRLARAEAYLDKVGPAISGSGGHAHTFVTAQKMVRGFDLSRSEAFALMSAWNRTCQPPWSDKDLRRKIDQADELGTMPRGQLLNARQEVPPHRDKITSFPNDSEQDGLPPGEEEITPAAMWKAALDRALAEGRFDDAAEALRRLTKVANSNSGGIIAESWQRLAPETLCTRPPPREWLLRHPDGTGMLARGRAGVIASAGGVGKTMATMQLAISVALGEKWLGHFDVDAKAQGGKVLLALAEEDITEVHRRLYWICEGLGLPELARRLLSERIVVLPLMGKPVCLVQASRDGVLSETDAMRDLREQLAAEDGWALVVLDPLARWAGGDVEVSNDLATRFVQAVESLCEAPGNPTVIVTHHSSKMSRRTGSVDARGVTALTDGFRWAGTMRADNGQVRFIQSKSNYSRGMDDELVLVRGEGGILRAQAEADRRAAEEAEEARHQERLEGDICRVVEALADEGEATSIDAIVALAGMKATRGRTAVRIALSRGLIKEEGTSRSKRFFTQERPGVPRRPSTSRDGEQEPSGASSHGRPDVPGGTGGDAHTQGRR